MACWVPQGQDSVESRRHLGRHRLTVPFIDDIENVELEITAEHK